MVKEKSRAFSKVTLLIVALVLALSSIFALSNVTVFAEEKEGIDLSKPFVTSYFKDQKITINGKEYTNIPNTTDGKLTFTYKNDDGNWGTREVDIEQAVINGMGSDDTKDRISFEGFSTTDNIDMGQKYNEKTMKLKFYPAGFNSYSYAIEIEYRIYTTSDYLAGMKQTTQILATVNKVLDNILAPLLIVMASIGMIFAIFLGIKLARANNAEEREEAKKRVIYTVVGIAICVALILIFKLFARYSIEWLGDASFFQLNR